jgi:hypothetical protein
MYKSGGPLPPPPNFSRITEGIFLQGLEEIILSILSPRYGYFMFCPFIIPWQALALPLVLIARERCIRATSVAASRASLHD